jgi:hypothetical protein
VKDEFKRAQHTGKYSYCPCCDGDPPTGKARRRVKDDAKKQLKEHEKDPEDQGPSK